MGHILKSLLKLIILWLMKPYKINVVKTRQWPYYINIYYKYIHGSFSINIEIYCYFKNNITLYCFCKNKKFRGPKNKNQYSKLNIPYFKKHLYYIWYNYKPKNALKEVIVCAFTPIPCVFWTFILASKLKGKWCWAWIKIFLMW
jgi:hypothetical protein